VVAKPHNAVTRLGVLRSETRLGRNMEIHKDVSNDSTSVQPHAR